ncbi:hypothetical protein K435DRAFT_784266, partial [Dendrothele bispora CBS 962.96]
VFNSSPSTQRHSKWTNFSYPLYTLLPPSDSWRTTFKCSNCKPYPAHTPSSKMSYV